jgi:hypothetical protein
VKKQDIIVGGVYRARVSGRITTVRVEDIDVAAIRRGYSDGQRTATLYHVTNLTTGRKTTFRSAQKFIQPASPIPTDKAPTPMPPASNGLAAKLNANASTRHVNTAPHVIIEALAGTGKTTTLVEGLKRLLGLPTSIDPSPQQQAIWEALELSKGVTSICFVAFNKGIATELQQRVPAGVNAMTMHSLGLKAVTAAFGRVQISDYRVSDIIADLLGKDLRDLKRTDFELVKATENLVRLCKMNLVGTDVAGHRGDWLDVEGFNAALDQLASHYDVELNGSRDKVYELVPKVLERCLDVNRDRKIDFNDMIWLPVALDLPVTQYDLLLVDEAQDLNRCQQQLAKKTGRRIVMCGDKHQAIYGFAGADAESIDRMKQELSMGKCRAVIDQHTPNECKVADGTAWDAFPHNDECRCVYEGTGCLVLPLTVTRRCGKAIVEEAKRIVPEFEAHESNCDGTISRAMFKADRVYPGCATDKEKACVHGNPWGGDCPHCDGYNQPKTISPSPDNKLVMIHADGSYRDRVLDGDMCICRVNAPLVSQCFRFLKAGRKAEIQGRDIGQGLISTVKKVTKGLTNPTVADLVEKLSDWVHQETEKENRKRMPSEARIIAITDRYDCLLCFTEGVTRVEDVIAKIERVFTDNRTSPGIKLSTIHKAKGLEAKRVFLLEPEGATVPHPMAKSQWQKGQEMNLRYVAITRAIEELVYVK